MYAQNGKGITLGVTKFVKKKQPKNSIMSTHTEQMSTIIVLPMDIIANCPVLSDTSFE